MTSLGPEVVIHAAAYTAVDSAEVEQEKAYLVNAYGSANVAMTAEQIGAKMCYISTDYVFDGDSVTPYREYDKTNPESVYGKSKRAGETFVKALSSRYFIVRTSWVYGLHGNNFVKTMLRLAEGGNPLRVVHDQIGCPTYTVDLCAFLEDLVASDKYGMYHAANNGRCSWYEFARAIFEEAQLSVHLDPCTTDDFPRLAPRPRYSVLDNYAIRANGFQPLRPWRDALAAFIQELAHRRAFHIPDRNETSLLGSLL